MRPETSAAQAVPAEARVEWRTDLASIELLEEPWRALERESRSRTVHSSWDYVCTWYRHLATSQRTPLLGAVWRGGALTGAAPLVAWRGTLGGVPVRRLDFVGHQWDGGELLLRDDEPEAAGHLIRSLARLGRFDVLCLNGLHAGGAPWSSIARAARGARLRLVGSEYAVAVVDLSGGFEGHCAAMSQNFRRSIKRMAKRIEGAGGYSLDRLPFGNPGRDPDPFLARMFSIGDRSWKTRTDGPMVREHREFNADVIRRFAARGKADIGILRIGGKDAAFIVALVEGDTYYDFTISFDDSFRELSPGIFLMIEVLRRIAAEGIRTVVSHGAHEYKRRWAKEFPLLSRAYLFPPTLPGFLSRAAKFTLPALWERLAPRKAARRTGKGTAGAADESGTP